MHYADSWHVSDASLISQLPGRWPEVTRLERRFGWLVMILVAKLVNRSRRLARSIPPARNFIEILEHGPSTDTNHRRASTSREMTARWIQPYGTRTMEIDQLRYFLQVAERGNFTRAAADLMISQPALSRSIQKLEAELGQQLFERKTRSVSLTDAGVMLQGRAQQVLSILEDTIAEITDDGQSGRLRIGAIPTVAPYFLPGILKAFAEQYPKATVIVHENTTANLVKSCTQGEVDLAILALPIPAKYLEVEKLFDEELLLVLPPDHPLANQQRIRLKDVEALPFVLLDEAHCLSDHIVSFCRQKSFQPVAVERTSQLAMVQELVSLSHGVSMIPAMARACDQSDRRIYRSFARPHPRRTIAVAWNPYRFQSRLLQAFRSHLRQSVKRTER